MKKIEVPESLFVVFGALSNLNERIIKLEKGIKNMATIQDVQAAIDAEKAQVQVRLDELQASIVALQEQVAAGSAATPEQLDELVSAVQNIFSPEVVVEPAPEPEVPVEPAPVDPAPVEETPVDPAA